MSEVGVRAAALILTLAALIAGCSEESAPPPAVIHDIGEPWQATPLLVDSAVYSQLEKACRDADMAPKSTPLSVIDVRGSGVGLVIVSDMNVEGDCLVIRDESGEFLMSGGSAASGPGLIQPIDPRAIASLSTHGAEVGPTGAEKLTYVVGQVGSEIGVVQAVLPDGTRVQASQWDRGWFAVWWPGNVTDVSWATYDRAGVAVTQPN